ncbi:hypothetical protein Slin14017_G096100 [Septoria linicola]|nr:hypothetical protein Slin14017_G096100 [Septoria linicola]
MAHQKYAVARPFLKTTRTAHRAFVKGVSSLLANTTLTPRDTLGCTIQETFQPFSLAFLHTAPRQTVHLLASLCAKPQPVPGLLRIPAELRILIYELVIETWWKEHQMNQSHWEEWHMEWYPPEPLEAPLLRVCKLMRNEGLEVYTRILKGKVYTGAKRPYVCSETRSAMVLANRGLRISQYSAMLVKDNTYQHAKAELTRLGRHGLQR